jgi:hypothetical protein
LGTKGVDDMQAVFRRDFIEVFKRIGWLRISLGGIIIFRGTICGLKLNRKKVWLVIHINVCWVLAEINNVSMKDIIIDCMIR